MSKEGVPSFDDYWGYLIEDLTLNPFGPVPSYGDYVSALLATVPTPIAAVAVGAAALSVGHGFGTSLASAAAEAETAEAVEELLALNSVPAYDQVYDPYHNSYFIQQCQYVEQYMEDYFVDNCPWHRDHEGPTNVIGGRRRRQPYRIERFKPHVDEHGNYTSIPYMWMRLIRRLLHEWLFRNETKKSYPKLWYCRLGEKADFTWLKRGFCRYFADYLSRGSWHFGLPKKDMKLVSFVYSHLPNTS